VGTGCAYTPSSEPFRTFHGPGDAPRAGGERRSPILRRLTTGLTAEETGARIERGAAAPSEERIYGADELERIRVDEPGQDAVPEVQDGVAGQWQGRAARRRWLQEPELPRHRPAQGVNSRRQRRSGVTGALG
jgi:hypothetical protein